MLLTTAQEGALLNLLNGMPAVHFLTSAESSAIRDLLDTLVQRAVTRLEIESAISKQQEPA